MIRFLRIKALRDRLSGDNRKETCGSAEYVL